MYGPNCRVHLVLKLARAPKDHINRRIPYSGSKSQDKTDCTSHGLLAPYVNVVFWVPICVALAPAAPGEAPPQHA